MKFEFCWGDRVYDCEWFNDVNFEELENVMQAYGFLFDDKGKICIVNVRHNEGGWCLPGGGPEECDESFEDTLRRETDEEADLDIRDLKRIGYVRAVDRGTGKVEHAVRYVAKVSEVREGTVDPAHGKIPLRKFVSPDDFIEAIGWGEDGGAKVQLNRAVEVFEKGRKRVGQVEVIVYQKVGDDYEFLMMKRTERKGGFWQPVTGGIHEGEDIIEAAHREVLEETGFGDVKLSERVHYFVLEKDNLPEYVFGAEVCCEGECCIDKNVYTEHEEFRWCSFEEAMELLIWEGNKEGLRRLRKILDKKNE